MATSQDELTQALSDALGSGPSSDEGLDYARNILAMYTGMQPSTESELSGLAEQEKDIVGALAKARQRIMEQTGPTRSEKLFALGRGLGQSTKTGSIGETASNVSAQMQPLAEEQRSFENEQDASLSQLDMAEVMAHGPYLQAELKLKELDKTIEGRMAQEALKTIARGSSTGRSSAAARTRREKIDDMMRLWKVPEAVAMAHVDGEIKMSQSPLGGTILTNDITGESFEVDAASPEDLAKYLPNDNLRGQGTGRPFSPSRETVDADSAHDTRNQIEIMADELVASRIDNGDSIWDMSDVSTGPYANLRVGASFVSSLFGGPVATKTIEGRHGLTVRGRDLAKALVPNDRMPVALVQMAIDDAAISPSILDTPAMMQTRLVSLDREMFDMWLDAVEDSTNRKLPPTMRKEQEQNAREISIFLRDLRVPEDRRDRRQRILPDGVLFPQSRDRELTPEEKTLKKPPKSFQGTQRQWDLMPLQDRQLYKDDY